MKKSSYLKSLVLIFLTMIQCTNKPEYSVEIIETSADEKKLSKIQPLETIENPVVITINPEVKFQTIEGIGGSFTESSAYLLNKLSEENRNKILHAYFSEDGANYSMTRTHIASCDFSLKNYTYAPVENDLELKNFTIKEDLDDLIPMIKDAQKISKDGFKIISSPWTAPPWMKDNKKWIDGNLLPEHYETFALYFTKYLNEYKKLGINIWGITVVNEPHGNGGNWESMKFEPKEMTDFVENNLGPKLEKEGFENIKILGYDQNRRDIPRWIDEMYRSEKSTKYYDGIAVHWYDSTFDVFEKELNYAHKKNPNKLIIETEGCIDAEAPVWKDDTWYWKKEATDWGWDWASSEDKPLHPKYSPVQRYAEDIIGCLNNHVNAWVDWNMVLNKQGGPNWFKNWCIAPIIVDEEHDEVYFTPLYYTMVHFSKYIRPNAKRIDFTNSDKELKVTAVENQDRSVVVVVYNPTEKEKNIQLKIKKQTINLKISKQALQTIKLKNN
jgi:glucosylceramidase